MQPTDVQEDVTVQWVAGALGAAQNELNLLELLSQAPPQRTLVALLGEEMAKAIQKLQLAERAYDMFLAENDVNEENIDEFHKLRKTFVKAFQRAQQLQRRNPDSARIIAENYSVKGTNKAEEGWSNMSGELLEYFELIHRRLGVISEGKDEPWTRQDAMSSLRASSMAAHSKKQDLQETLSTEELGRASAVSQYRAKIDKLQQEITRLQSLTETNARNIHQTDEEERKILDATHQKTLEALTNEIDTCIKRLETKTEEHRDSETSLKKKVNQVDIENEKLMKAYDKEMIDLAKKIDGLQQHYNAESERLAELQDKTDDLVNEREEWEKQLADAQRQKELEDQTRDRAATTLQASFRGFKVRKELDKKKRR